MNRMFGMGANPNEGDIPYATLTEAGLIRLATEQEAASYNPLDGLGALTPATTSVLIFSGWIPVYGTAWTYVSADAPIFVVNIPVNDVDNYNIRAGTKIRIEQSGTKFFVVVGVGAEVSGFYPVTIYGGNHSVLTSAAITQASFSDAHSPMWFPMERSAWDLETNTSDSPAKAGPTASTWYGGSGLTPTGPSIIVPIGAWYLRYKITADYSTNLAAVANIGLRATLSNANNTASDPDFTTGFTVTLPISATALQRATYQAEKLVVLAAKTTYYVNLFSGTISGTSPSFTMNAGGVFRNIIRARFAYL
jgi:hypothetical protein